MTSIRKNNKKPMQKVIKKRAKLYERLFIQNAHLSGEQLKKMNVGKKSTCDHNYEIMNESVNG